MQCADALPLRTAEIQSRLGEALLMMGRREEAERTIDLALPVLTANGDSVERAVALNNLGLIRRWQRRYSEAIEYVAQSEAILEKMYFPDHPVILRPLNNLAVLYTWTGRNTEADAIFQRALDICRKKLPENHPSYVALLQNYAVFLRKTGEKSRAKTIEAKARSLVRENSRRDGLSLTVDVSSFRHP
jgi:tetratricopeptide (TPR) repeat protein